MMTVSKTRFQKRLLALGRAIAPQRGQQSSHSQTGDPGVTLLECLVAIAVVALLGAMITPPLFVAAATRVQNRRAEQAFQLAQGEIDRIRTLVARAQQEPDNLPEPAGATIEGVAAPTAIATDVKSVNPDCDTYTGAGIPTSDLIPVDITGDDECNPEFYMQVFRSNGTESPSASDDRLIEFQVGVRVYYRTAGDNLDELETTPASLQFTTGEGNQRTRPLAVVFSSFNWSERSNALCAYTNTDGTSRCDL